jgi:hypothetical protein
MDNLKDNIKDVNNKNVHTLAEDMGFAVRENKDGFVKQIILDQERKEVQKKQREIYNKRNRLYLIFSIMFMSFALLALLFFLFKEETENFFFKRRNPSIIFHETTKVIDITDKNKNEINTLIRDNVNQVSRKAGLLEGLYFTKDKKTVGVSSLLASLESSFVLEKDIFNENFLVGIMNFDQSVGNDPDFIDRNTNQNIPANNSNPESNINLNEGEILDDFIIFSDNEFFESNTLNFKADGSKEKAKELLGYLLSLISFEDSKIQVFGIYAKDLNNNQSAELALNKKKIGFDLLNEVLKEKYTNEQIAKLTIEQGTTPLSLSDIYTENKLALMSDEEKETNTLLLNGIKYKIEPKIKTDTRAEENSENITLMLENKLETTVPVVSNFKKDTDLFILFKINAFGGAFNQMRIWENKMFLDLHGFFGYDISAFTNYLLTKDFQDGFVQNKNARILYDNTGKVVLMYVFVDEEFLVITNTEQAVKEAMLRVNSSKIKK